MLCFGNQIHPINISKNRRKQNKKLHSEKNPPNPNEQTKNPLKNSNSKLQKCQYTTIYLQVYRQPKRDNVVLQLCSLWKTRQMPLKVCMSRWSIFNLLVLVIPAEDLIIVPLGYLECGLGKQNWILDFTPHVPFTLHHCWVNALFL